MFVSSQISTSQKLLSQLSRSSLISVSYLYIVELVFRYEYA